MGLIDFVFKGIWNMSSLYEIVYFWLCNIIIDKEFKEYYILILEELILILLEKRLILCVGFILNLKLF